MKIIILLILISGAVSSFAQDKEPTKEVDQKQSHVLMHEQMAKAHQQAADCLKSGKTAEECRKAFHEMCKESGNPDMCGPRMHHKMGRKTK